MLITRKSMFTGKVRTRDLPVTEEQMTSYKNGMSIQFAMSHLKDSDREFILTGVTEGEWDEFMGKEEDEED